MNPDDVLLGFVLVVLWLLALTANHARIRRELGEPVYRRLPNGRIRFEWSVGAAFHQARRAAERPRPDPAERPPNRPGPDLPR